jgi:predicted phosphodiesterase
MTLKYLREFSDMHLNFYFGNKVPFWVPEPLDTDKETALILAGDLWEGTKFIKHSDESWIQPLAERFHSVFIVAGNHDIWDENIHKYHDKARIALQDMGLTNVHILENNAMVIDNVKFIGGTLWTDFNNADPFTLWQAKNHMNDYKYIRAGNDYRKVTSDDIFQAHKKTKKFIFENAKKDNDDQKIVVITHHSPSFQGLNDYFRSNGYTNGYYHSNFDELIETSEIGLWVYGHTHSPKIYKIGNTTLMNNAVGYFGHENTKYDPINLIDISTL